MSCDHARGLAGAGTARQHFSGLGGVDLKKVSGDPTLIYEGAGAKRSSQPRDDGRCVGVAAPIQVLLGRLEVEATPDQLSQRSHLLRSPGRVVVARSGASNWLLDQGNRTTSPVVMASRRPDGAAHAH